MQDAHWIGFYWVEGVEKLKIWIIREDNPEPPTGPWRLFFGHDKDTTTYRRVEDAKEGARAVCANIYHDRVALGRPDGHIEWRDLLKD